MNEYVFEKNGKIYTVTIRINDAVKTDAQWKRLTEAFGSMQFFKKMKAILVKKSHCGSFSAFTGKRKARDSFVYLT